jgi:cytochrome d ubiquinol oxidase subunit I
MDALTLSRIQFGVTVGFHFIFPSITIGLAWLVFFFMSRWRRSGRADDGAVARFWSKLLALTFAVGVATGITMEFQFGTNWAPYARFVGDIFGAPLAFEGIFAFFLESTFLAVLVFGWSRVSTRTLWVSSLLVALGATLSAFFILAANSWQQTPAGFRLAGGRAELTSLAEAVLNPSTVPRFLHTLDAVLTAGAFFVMGLSAWFLLRGRHVEFAKRSLTPALIAALATSILQLGLGHAHAVQVAGTQKEKLAAMDLNFETRREAPLVVFGIPDREGERVRWAVEVPGALSILAGFSPATEVKGLKDFPKDEWPPLAPSFYSFHAMVALGGYFVALCALGAVLLWRKMLYAGGRLSRIFLKAALLSIPLPIVANELGWILAEMGRQPWVVYHLLRTQNACSATVPPGQVLVSLVGFSALYLLLFVLWIFVLRREMLHGPEGREGEKAGAAA